MTLGTERRDALRKLANRIRAIPGRDFGLRPHTVEVAVGTWSGTHTGDDIEAKTWTEITEQGQPPKVRWANDQEVALGNLPAGVVTIGPVTPSFPGGGTLFASLTGSAATRGQTFHIRITGPNHPDGAIYSLHDASADRALRYTIRVKPVAQD